MAARVVDWGLALLVAALLLTGAVTLFAGVKPRAWVYDVHDGCGAAITVLLVLKLRRVWPRLTRPRRQDWRTTISMLAVAFAVAGLASGVLWASGVTPAPAGYSLLSWHDAFGVVLLLVVAGHMILRAKRLRGRDLAHRRQFLALGALAIGSTIAWGAQRPLERLLNLRGARRRFTGSYEADSFAGNAFPTTSWVADAPRPIATPAYRLRVTGLGNRELTLQQLGTVDELTATLDCTGGFYSTQRWQGITLGRLLDLADADSRARHVSIVSVTGYRWSFSIANARGLLLATAVEGQPLGHGHGAPVRLVVPAGRGYQWVKWVERVELRRDPDYTAPASTVWSSFTTAGRGD